MYEGWAPGIWHFAFGREGPLFVSGNLLIAIGQTYRLSLSAYRSQNISHKLQAQLAGPFAYGLRFRIRRPKAYCLSLIALQLLHAVRRAGISSFITSRPFIETILVRASAEFAC